MPTTTFRALTLGALLMVASAASAAQVYWENPGPLGAGQRAGLDLVFDGTEPAEAVTLPPINGLDVLADPSPASSLSIINGKQRSTLTLSYPVRAGRDGRIQIPAFEVETSAGTQTVAALTIEIGAATMPGARGEAAKLSDVVQARLTPSNMTPYAGEVFDVDMTIAVAGGRRGEVAGTPRWTPSGVTVEPWSDGEAVRTQSGSGVRFRTRAAAPEAGRRELASATQEVQVETGRERNDPFGAFGSLRGFGAADDFFDSFFSRGRMTDATVASNAVQLDVRALPVPAPADFSGAVGQFALDSTLSPAQPKTGEPVTWTLTLTGSGNWPTLALPARAVPASLRALQPKQRKQFADGERFVGEVSEDLVLVPSQPGDYTLEPVRFTYFDPTTERYETAVAQPPLLHVTGAPLQSAAAAAPAAAAVSSASAPDAAADPSAAPHDGAPGVREPLAGRATGRAPLPWSQLRWLVCAPLALLGLFWIGLAVRRARLTDPSRPRRAALVRAHEAALRARFSATAGEQAAALLDWQQAVAAALAIDLATPTTVQVRDRVGADWRDLWLGSEQALYGPEHHLPAGWCEAALALCARPRRGWLRRSRAQPAALPRLATASLAMCLATAAAAAPPAQGPVGSADPRTGLRERVSADGSDWIARYNLGVAEAQQGDDGRAFGQTLAAFAHAPRDPSVRRNAALFGAKLPGVEAATAALIGGGLAALAAPAWWQLGLVGGVVMFSLAAALLLHCVYLRTVGAPLCGRPQLRRARAATQGRPYLSLGLALTAIGLATVAVSGLALQRWGTMTDPRAATVAAQTALRAVPTDASQDRQPRPLAAGALVTVGQEFLGWTKVGLGDGASGWVRNGDLVPLYAGRSA